MRHTKVLSYLFVLLIILFPNPTKANEFADQLNAHANDVLMAWTTSPDILAAIQEQNKEHTSLTQDDIDALDKQWRAEVGTDGELISRVLAKPISEFLKGKKEESAGLYTEIFIMDNKGLNVGQSDVTSDYWQGDEAKWKVPFHENTINLGDVEMDESTQTFQSQINMPIINPDTGNPIGAMTVGINLEMLQ